MLAGRGRQESECSHGPRPGHQAGFEIAIPDDWSAVDAESILSDPAMQSLLEEMAARQGVTTDQLMGSGIDMIAMSDQGIPNVNVIEPQPGRLGSGFASQITAQLETAFSATDVATREETTAVGDALVASYTATIQGAVFYQNQIYQQVGPSIAVVTVTGKDADQAAELTGIILDTIKPVGD